VTETGTGGRFKMNLFSAKIGPLQIGIILIAIYAAIVHLTLFFPDVAFILNGLGYLGLAGALYLALPFFKDHRSLVRYVLMGYALLTVILWVFIGERSVLGYTTTFLEVVLVVLLWIDRK
jgi:hypothetical protein